MTIASPTTLKTYFERGDRPTQAQFGDLIDSAIPELNVKHWGAVGDGSTDDGPAIQAAATALAAAGGGNLIFPPSSGTYKIATAVTTGTTVFWIMRGGNVEPTAATLINGGVIPLPLHRPCFTVVAATASASLLKIRNADAVGAIAANASVSPYTSRMSPMWFDGSSMSQKIQKVYQVGGAKTTCSVPAGIHTITSTIVPGETDYGSHLVLEGESYLATTLQMAAGAAICGVDCSDADEVEIRNIRITEGSGQRTGIGIALGGTSLKIRDCWTGNLAYGLYMNRGAGTKITNHFSENCLENVYIAPNDDVTGTITGAPAPSGGLTDILIMGGQLTGGEDGLRIVRAGSNIIRGLRVVGTSFRENNDHAVHMTDSAGTDGCRGAAFIGCEFSGALGGGTALAGFRIRNMNAVLHGCTLADNNNTGLIAEQTCNVVLMGCQFGNFSGSTQATTVSINGGSPVISEVYCLEF